MVREIAARKLATRRRVVQAGLEHVIYRRRGSTDAQAERARNRALCIVAGMEREPLLSAAEAVAERLAATVGPEARFLLDHHLAAGDVCVVLSSSPEELVERIGRLLGMHGSLGTRSTVADGRYTGALDRPLCCGAGKVDALRLAWDAGCSPRSAQGQAPRSSEPLADEGDDPFAEEFELACLVNDRPHEHLLHPSLAEGMQLLGERAGGSDGQALPECVFRPV
ncbi:MAG TPA: haloacid dehalogenase-like hydrolase, partial [Acidimicrobiales bacterium]|nr:haloacid dehalogenase-like hydrolase [Acidimicrobiales bacterium]